ncbi:MAG: type II toxin-antitoxin system Phd/YefM family antitoxin [Thermodesulfobacteriota bacterium]|nr:type II toxin-antitoxin system Phd/YefM family antitoxin [Thermodesulfobacteriota bacterium]
MEQINIHEAKTQFSKLIVSVEKGNKIIIARHGKPVAKLVPFQSSVSSRKPGSAKGKFTVPSDFFEPLPDDLLSAFE